MTAPAQTTTRTTASGGLEWTFAGEQPDPHAKAIERIRLITKPQSASNEQSGEIR